MDLEPGFEFISARVRALKQQDLFELETMMSLMLGTNDEALTLSAEDSQNLHWHADKAFRVRRGVRRHAGQTQTFIIGLGSMSSSITKQNVNSRSSTESELIAIDDEVSKILREKRITKAQGLKVNLSVVFQDDTNMIKVASGKSSSGKRTRHFDIHLFHVIDLIIRNEAAIKCCTTGKMRADYFSKTLICNLFRMMRIDVMSIALREQARSPT